MKSEKSKLNKPVVILGIMTTMTALMSTSCYTKDSYTSRKNEYSLQYNTNNNNQMTSYLEEYTTINDNVNLGYEHSYFNNTNEIYVIRDSKINLLDDAKYLFGEMVYLSEEGQKEYNQILEEIFDDTEIQLFNFV